MRDDLDLLLPEIILNTPDLSMARLNQMLHYSQRMPSIPGHSIEKFFMSNRAEEAAQYAQAMGVAFEEARQMDILMRAKARAEGRLAQRYAEGR